MILLIFSINIFLFNFSYGQSWRCGTEWTMAWTCHSVVCFTSIQTSRPSCKPHERIRKNIRTVSLLNQIYQNISWIWYFALKNFETTLKGAHCYTVNQATIKVFFNVLENGFHSLCSLKDEKIILWRIVKLN